MEENKVLSEDDHAATLPTGTVIIIIVAAVIGLGICLLFIAKGCSLEPQPTVAPVIYPQKVTQPITPALPVIPKHIHKRKSSPNVDCKIGVDPCCSYQEGTRDEMEECK